jgi:hypothetical protein
MYAIVYIFDYLLPLRLICRYVAGSFVGSVTFVTLARLLTLAIRMKRSSSFKTEKHQAAGSPNPQIKMSRNWEPVLTEDKLKEALAQRAETLERTRELENRVKALRVRRLER